MDFKEESEKDYLSSTIVKEEYSIQENNTAEFPQQNGDMQGVEMFVITEITPSLPDEINEMKEEEHKCLICGKFLSSSTKLNQHMTIHANMKNFHCAHCPKAYGNKDTLRVHVKAHFEKSHPVTCPICKKTFKNDKSMKSHHRRHKKTKNHNCEYCGKDFLYRSGLIKHIGRMHDERKKPPRSTPSGVEKKPLTCPQCGLFFWGQFAFDRHLKSHENIQALECSICSRTFNYIKNLNKHMLNHGTPTLECEICHKKFAHVDSLTRHKKTHTADSKKSNKATNKVEMKSLKCNYCNRTFGSVINVQNHHKNCHLGLEIDFSQIEPTNAKFAPPTSS